jgi:PTS system nitrogen regulatory IIA component
LTYTVAIGIVADPSINQHGSPVPDLFTPKQLAEYLQLSSRTVYRLLERNELPGFRVGGQWRFRKSEVDYWLDRRLHQLGTAELRELETDAEGDAPPPMADLLDPRNVVFGLPGGDQASVVRGFVARLAFPEHADQELLVQRILEREAMCSTALPDGVALLQTPRIRPRVLAAHDFLAVGRLGAPLAFGAIDGSLTDTLVLVLARSERTHLLLLAKMARLFRESGFVYQLRHAATASEILDLIHTSERTMFGDSARLTLSANGDQ